MRESNKKKKPFGLNCIFFKSIPINNCSRHAYFFLDHVEEEIQKKGGGSEEESEKKNKQLRLL